MDSKEARLIVDFHQKLANLSFNEKDILGFLILLRQYSPAGSPVYEFANFIAHRERDRGHIYDYLFETKQFFNAIGTQLSDIHELREVFTEQEIGTSFSSVLKDLGAPAPTDEALRGITLCIISLLQAVKITDKNGTEIGELHFAYDRQRIYLFGFFSVADFAPYSHLRVPVLSIENCYLETDSTELQLPEIVEVVSDAGKLEVRTHSVPTTV